MIKIIFERGEEKGQCVCSSMEEAIKAANAYGLQGWTAISTEHIRKVY